MTTAGMLDREITVEVPSTIDDPVYGPQAGPWLPLVRDGVGSPILAKRFPAQLQDVMPSRSEAVQQGLAIARNQTRIRMRWRDDITSAMRITVHGDTDTVYQIVGGPAAIEGRKQFLEVVCEHLSSGG